MNAELLLTALLRLTLLASAALLLLAAGRPVLRRALGARATYAAWLLVPLLIASPWLPRTSLPAPAALALPAALPLAPVDAEPVNAAVVARPASHGPMALLLTWMLGAATLAAAQWRAQRRYEAGLWRDANGQWRAPAGHSPAVVGLWPGRLVLPADFACRFDAPTRQLMLAHEAVHLRRQDNAWNLLALLLLCLQWFNPLAWWGRRALRQDQELACDEAVLDSAAEPGAQAAYAEALLAAHQGTGHPALASGWSSAHPLVKRLTSVARHRRVSPLRRCGGMLLVTSLGLGGALLARAAQEPRTAPPPPAAAAQALQITLASQWGTRDWQHTSLQVPKQNAPQGTLSASNLHLMQDGWCLGVMTYTFADGQARYTAHVLDEACKTLLTPPQDVTPDGRLVQFATQTPQGPLQAQVSLRWGPATPVATASHMPPLSAAQQAVQDRWRTRADQEARDLQAQDRAWRAAREAQAQAQAQPGTR